VIDAYLDIETTGLSRWYHQITVIGIYLVDRRASSLVQLVGDGVSEQALLQALQGVRMIFTYNGSRFDLPFIRTRLDVDLTTMFNHHDLMYDCWRRNLTGGLKAVERTLGIPRQLADINGRDAVTLWHRYEQYADRNALSVLLRYNGEDVTNLKILRERLSLFGRIE